MARPICSTEVPGALPAFASRMMSATFSPAATEGEARQFLHGFEAYPPVNAIFVDQPWVEMARDILAPQMIRVGVEAAYPVGNWSTQAKVAAIREGIRRGADEIDIGCAFAAIKSGQFDEVEHDARAMAEAAGDDIWMMVIPETAILTSDELLRTLEAFARAGVQGIKTSSGYGWNTQLEHVALIRRAFGSAFKVDVSGGVRTLEDALAYFAAGTDHIHASPIFRILDQAKERWS